jgi:superfamily II DNA or RNA helicase
MASPPGRREEMIDLLSPEPTPTSSKSIPGPVHDPISDDTPDLQADGVHKEPRAYQRTAIEAVSEALDNGTSRVGVSAPTGAGKTVIFAQIILATLKTHTKGKVLVLVDTKEQAKQAKRRIQLAHGERMVYIGEERGKLSADPWDQV